MDSAAAHAASGAQRGRDAARLWLRRNVFDLVYRRSLIYNQCWEDPAVDRQALRLTAADRVLVITSAGCNALDYALTGARVLAWTRTRARTTCSS